MEKEKLSQNVQEYIKYFKEKTGCDIEIELKSNSSLMKLIGGLFKLTNISPEFMTRYYTTIGNTVYVPEESLTKENEENFLRVIAHESIHIFDSNRLGNILFKFLYLFPQSLSIFSLLAFLAFWKIKFLYFLLCLLFLSPLPAPFRYWFELRAYRTSILFARKKDKLKDTELEPIYNWIIEQLSTKFYYFTWPFPKMIYKNLKDESFISDKEYSEIINLILIEKALKEKDKKDA